MRGCEGWLTPGRRSAEWWWLRSPLPGRSANCHWNEQGAIAIAQLERGIGQGSVDASPVSDGPIPRTGTVAGLVAEDESADHHVVACLDEAARADVGQLAAAAAGPTSETSASPMPVLLSAPGDNCR